MEELIRDSSMLQINAFFASCVSKLSCLVIMFLFYSLLFTVYKKYEFMYFIL